MKLIEILKSMDLPEGRLDLSKEENLRWLLRNIRIQNGDHEQIDVAVVGIISLLNPSKTK